MSYKYITNLTSVHQNARDLKIKGITIHWWGRPSGQSVSGIAKYLCKNPREVSAHYVVSDGIVYCIVDPDRRAWHAGNGTANHHQIGLELDPNASKRAGTMRTAAELIANLRKTYGDLPLSPHSRWANTQCPGNYDLKELDRLARGAKASVSKPSVKPKPVSKPGAAPAFPLPNNFYYGPKEGGVQSVSGRTYNSKVPYDVVKDKNGKYYSKGLKQAQQKLKDRGWTISVDGRFGPQTEKVVGQFKKNKKGWTDSRLGPETWKLIFTLPVT